MEAPVAPPASGLPPPSPPVTAVTCASWPRVSPEEGVHPWAQVEIELRDPR